MQYALISVGVAIVLGSAAEIKAGTLDPNSPVAWAVGVIALGVILLGIQFDRVIAWTLERPSRGNVDDYPPSLQ